MTMEGVLGIEVILSQILVVNPPEMDLETAVEDPDSVHQVLVVNTEEIFLETAMEHPQAFETTQETSVEDLGGLQDQLKDRQQSIRPILTWSQYFEH